MMNLLVITSALLLLIFPLSCRCQTANQVILTCAGGGADPVPGPAGPPGPVGPQGIQGPKGEPGDNNTCDYVFTRIEERLVAMEKKLSKAANCSTNGNSQHFTITQVDCPPGFCGKTYSCGTGIYSLNSSVCSAAVQQGIIQENVGGSVTFLRYTDGVSVGNHSIVPFCNGSWFTFHDVDECATSTPCQNNASCVNLLAGFRCICSSWYGGKKCEKDCSLGVRYNRKTIPDSAMTASSYWAQGIDTYHQPKFGRLNQPFIPGVTIGAWVPQHQHQGEWIQVALPRPETITGVITQGRGGSEHEQWVTSYKIAYQTSNTTSWKYVSYANGSDVVFNGNTDRTTPVTGRFPQPVIATKLRLYPQTYYRYMALRHEYLIC